MSVRFCRIRLTSTLAIWLLILSGWSNANDWPIWRGANQDGTFEETEIPLSWSQNENVHWRLALPGVGHSSPVISGNQIFVTACDLEAETRQLICVDRESGRVVWEQVVTTCPIETMHRDNTPASATPACDGNLVYCAFCESDSILVAAYDYQGNLQWSVAPGSFESRHGFCTSIVPTSEGVLISGLQDGPDAFLALLDSKSGKTIWKTPRRDKVRSFSTPFVTEAGEELAVILSGANQTVAYDLRDGSELWAVDGPAEKTVSSVVRCRESGLIFVAGGRDKRFLALQAPAPEADAPTIRWQAAKGIPYMTSPLVSNGIVHILADDGVYRAYDAETGEVLNERRAVGPVRASMIANKERIYVTAKSGKTTVIANNSNWEVLSECEIGEEVLASLAVSDGDIVIRSTEALWLIRDESELKEVSLK